MRISVHWQRTNWSEFCLCGSYSKQRRPRMCCHRAQNLLVLWSPQLSFRPLQVDSLFPISRPHPFYELHYFVHYAYIIHYWWCCRSREQLNDHVLAQNCRELSKSCVRWLISNGRHDCKRLRLLCINQTYGAAVDDHFRGGWRAFRSSISSCLTSHHA